MTYRIAFWDDSCHIFYSTDTGVTWATAATPSSTLVDFWGDMQMALNDSDTDHFYVFDSNVNQGHSVGQGGIEAGQLSNIAALPTGTLINYGTVPFGGGTSAIAGDVGAYSSSASKIMIAINYKGSAISTYVPRISNDGGVTWSNISGLSSSNGWIGVAFNQNASVIYIQEYQGKIQKSSDGGSTWTSLSASPSFGSGTGQPETPNTYRLRTNQSGTVVAAMTFDGVFHLSTNGGTTWGTTNLASLVSAVTINFADFGMTQNGSKFVAMISGIDPVSGFDTTWAWTSNNGTSWTQVFPPWGVANKRQGLVINVSQDNQCIVVGYDRVSDAVYHADISVNAGSTWTTVTFGVAADILTTVFVINGSKTKNYIERMADRILANGIADAWFVDAGLGYKGAAVSTFSGGEHLGGQEVTGLADGNVISQFVMPASGIFTLGVAAANVNVGLGYTAKLQTLPLDIGEPSMQGKTKKIPFVDIRVAQTLQLEIGATFGFMTFMKDLVVGNVSSTLTGVQTSQIITGLVNGDARTFLDASYTVYGQYCIRQAQPLPSTVLGVFPALQQGDDR